MVLPVIKRVEYLDGITLQDLLEQQTARAANDYVI